MTNFMSLCMHLQPKLYHYQIQSGDWPTCLSRESNPGLLRGKRGCYHYTTQPTFSDRMNGGRLCMKETSFNTAQKYGVTLVQGQNHGSSSTRRVF